jgi:hypothetical protein
VDVVLRVPDGTRIDALSLHPELGYLRLFAGAGSEPLEPLPIAKLADAHLHPEPTTEELRVSGVNVWYTLPPSLRTESFRLQAVYAAPGREEIVVSGEISVRVESVTDATREAAELMDDPEARRYLFHLGGYGEDPTLRELSERFDGTPYADYANLALGVSLALPHRYYDTGRGLIAIREPDLERASEYLDKADRTDSTLSRSYALVLRRAIAHVNERRAVRIAGTDPATAIIFFQRASHEYAQVAALAGAGGVLSPAERRAVELARAGMTRIDTRRASHGGGSPP